MPSRKVGHFWFRALLTKVLLLKSLGLSDCGLKTQDFFTLFNTIKFCAFTP